MKKSKKRLYYLLVIVLLLLVSVGYAVLSNNLNIVGVSTINNSTWDIHWENVQVKTGSVTASTPTIDTAKTTVSYSVALTIPGDYYEFTVDAVNAGAIDGMVSVVSNKLNGTEITTLPSYLEYKVTYDDGVDIAPNHLLAANTSEKYKVHVGYKKDISVSDIPSNDQTLNLSFSAITLPLTIQLIYKIVKMITGFRILHFDILFTIIAYLYIAATIYIMNKNNKVAMNKQRIKSIKEEIQDEIQIEEIEAENQKEKEEVKKKDQETEKRKKRKQKTKDKEKPEPQANFRESQYCLKGIT